jgi:hypothetical protein
MNLIGTEITNYYLLFRPTNAQHKYTNNIFYISLSTPTCFDAPPSFSGSLNFVPAKVTKWLKLLKLQLNTAVE